MIEVPCAVCGDTALEEFSSFSALPRVTSDCKPWPAGGQLCGCTACGGVQKIADSAWLAEAQRIYCSYELYHLSGGAEQTIFTTSGEPKPRSQTLVDFAVGAANLDRTGNLIDIGCGNGAALANLASALPDWDLYGHELGDSAEASLRSLPRFRRLFTGDLASIPGRYEFVSMIHSLEHMPDPLTTLQAIRPMLAEDGWLLVEVPDATTSTFDLIVADHRMHFAASALARIVERAGFRVEILSRDVLPKELTLLAQTAPPGTGAGPIVPDAAAELAGTEMTLRWLERLIAHAKDISNQRPFGIFGTAIAGMWLFGALRDRVDFFVDEEPSRIGRSYEGRPIYAPAEVPIGATLYVPLVPPIAANVVSRLGGRGARYVAPPR